MDEKILTDNYYNPVVERIFHGHYTAYELIHDTMGGYYVNRIYNPNTDKQKYSIIAKFQNNNSSDSLDYFYARLFWDALKIKI
jgi:hypothetical protein